MLYCPAYVNIYYFYGNWWALLQWSEVLSSEWDYHRQHFKLEKENFGGFD